MHLCTPPSLFPSPCPCSPPLPYGRGCASLDIAVSRRRGRMPIKSLLG